MSDVAIIIPVGPAHLQSKIYERAIASVEAQTIPTRYIVSPDPQGRGPAVVRNEALRQVDEKWTVFLDADDELEPEFVKHCLATRRAWPNNYVFTDWYQNGVHMRPPSYPWCQLTAKSTRGGQFVVGQNGINVWEGGTGWHVVTALLPTHWIRHIRGFDETMTEGGEDTAFYWKLTRAGCCGVHVPIPLLHYHDEPGSRAKRWHDHPRFEHTMEAILSQYEGMMGCCGQSPKLSTAPVGAKQEGDILAISLWMGKRQEIGVITGRTYVNVGNYRPAWIHPADVSAAPGKFRAMTPPPPPPLPPQDDLPEIVEEPPDNEPLTFVEAAQKIGKKVAHSDGVKPYRPSTVADAPLSWQDVIAMGKRVVDIVASNCTECGAVVGVGSDDGLCQKCKDAFWEKRWSDG